VSVDAVAPLVCVSLLSLPIPRLCVALAAEVSVLVGVRATVTLRGDRFKSMALPEVGMKMIAAMNRPFLDVDMAGADVLTMQHGAEKVSVASIDIHGQRRLRSWTKLATTVNRGESVITVAEDVDWGVGDSLIVTSSERGGWEDETEEVVVAEVLSPRSLRLTKPLNATHRSEWYSVPGFAPVDMRVEVGLLTRNVVVQGDERSTEQLLGVHVMAVHGAMLRLSGSEFRRCGQFGVLGRYCTHIHMASKQENAFIVDNSIHHSFQRAVTIHGTHYARVAHNVAFDVRGHTFFVEDGGERYNVFEGNLAALTRCSEVRACAVQYRSVGSIGFCRSLQPYKTSGALSAAGPAGWRQEACQLLDVISYEHLAP
jgi:hypothetical protein